MQNTGRAILNRKTILISIGILILVIIATTCVLVLIHKPIKTKNFTANNKAIQISPEEIIGDYSKSNSAALAKLSYVQSAPTSFVPSLGYKDSSKTYSIYIEPDSNISFTKESTDQQSNDNSVLSSINSFFTTHQLIKQSTSVLKGSVLYSNSENVCQLLESNSNGATPANFSIVCSSIKNIDAHYATIQSRLNSYEKIHSVGKIDSINFTTISTDNKSLEKLVVSSPSSSPSAYIIYFAAINDVWEYIGTQGVLMVDAPSVHDPQTDLITSLKDPKYGTFLTDNIILNK